jgi:hypothetical protein
MRNKLIVSKRGMSVLQGMILAIIALSAILALALPRQLQAKDMILSVFNLNGEEKSEAAMLVPAGFEDNAYAYFYAEGVVSDEEHIPSVSPLSENSGIFNSFSNFEPKSSKCLMPDGYPDDFSPDGCLIFSYESKKDECAVNLFDPRIYTPLLRPNQFNQRYRVRENKINEIRKRCVSGYSCEDGALDVLSYFYDYGFDEGSLDDQFDIFFKSNLICISPEKNIYLWLRCDKAVGTEIIEDYASKAKFECNCPKSQPCFWKIV